MTSLVVQWMGIHLPIQRTLVWSLVPEDATYCGATKPARHNCWAHTLEPASSNFWAHVLPTTETRAPRACALQREALPLQQTAALSRDSKRKPMHSNEDLVQPKRKK